MIKKLILSALLLASSFVLFGCGSSPRDAAESFYDCMADNDIEGAKEYASPATQQLLSVIQSMGGIPEEDREDMSIKFISEEIDGDHATVVFEGEDGERNPVKLTLIEGEWKVDIEK